ncbi:hypothetical protein MUK42_05941 [Musa troglodytarum]|uniref:Uncharacterized protein n=1 Tax=Musa troglodytarum TaxID=320322 RepID=A0A9E7GD07_9LILI|nr:hypothetical protein MUK42_05941 [Musa troglodytarum]
MTKTFYGKYRMLDSGPISYCIIANPTDRIHLSVSHSTKSFVAVEEHRLPPISFPGVLLLPPTSSSSSAAAAAAADPSFIDSVATAEAAIWSST